jgi:thioredoxin 1
MKRTNVLLIAIGVVLAAIVFMLIDVMPGRLPAGVAQNADLREAIASGQPVLLEFGADWCEPCRLVAPVLDELAQEVKGKARVVRLSTDEYGDLAREFGVQPIPAFIVLKNGKETERQTGAIDKATMRRMLGI